MNRVKILLEEIGLKSNYTLFEEGKESNEVKTIAKKRGIKLPSKDIALFKCKYAFVDKENLNGCILPRKEVEKALDTLNSKAIDKDHLRKQTVGYWLEAALIKDEVIAYGCFWKSNFAEEYQDIKDRMKEGKVKISFEAWGNREFNEDKTYNLTDLEFAGGALLFDTDPAFPDAEVLNFSSINERQLEFAKIIEDSNKLVKCEKCNSVFASENSSECINCKHIEENKIMKESQKVSENIEESSFSFNWDKETIARMMCETECPTCKTKGWNDILNINFEDNKIKSRCPYCNGVNEYDLTPTATIVKKGKKPEPIKLAQTSTLEKPIENKELSKNLKEKEGKNLMDEFLRKYNKASVDELVKFLDTELASIKLIVATKDQDILTKTQELTSKDAELVKNIADNKLMVENAKIELETVKTELAGFKAEESKKIADEKAAIVKSRKEGLAEYAKDMSDEDILNDLKFENAKLKKERDEAIKKASDKGLAAGATVVIEDETVKKQKSIQARAWESKQ